MTQEQKGDLLEGGTPKEAEVKEPEVKAENVEQIRDELQKMEQNLKSAQGVTKKQAQELEELRGKYSEAVSSRDTYQALIGLVSQQTGRSEEDIAEEVQAKKPDLMKAAQDIIQRQEVQRQQTQLAEKVNSYQKKVEGLGLKETDPAYKRIRAFAKAGDFESADEEIETLKNQEPAKETGETEEEMRKRIAEEEREKFFEEHPELLKSETGEPSAAGGITMEEFRKLPPEERVKRLPEIRKTMEGK